MAMTENSVEKKVLEIIQNKLGLAKKPTPEKKINDDLGADSLDEVEIVMELEDCFDISIPDEEIERLKKVKDIVEYIKSKI